MRGAARATETEVVRSPHAAPPARNGHFRTPGVTWFTEPKPANHGSHRVGNDPACTDTEDPAMEITQALHRAAQQTPDLPATIAGERVRTWAECLDRVARLAGALHALGVGPGDRVAMLSLNSDRYPRVPVRGAVGGRRRHTGEHPLEPRGDRVLAGGRGGGDPARRRHVRPGRARDPGGRAGRRHRRLLRRRRRPRGDGRPSRRSSPGTSRCRTRAAAAPSPTASTTPAAPRARPRASCSATRTCSRRRWAARPPARS